MSRKKDIEKLEKFIKDAESSPAKVDRATQRYEEARGRRNKEVELWHTWNSGGRQPEHLEPLLKSVEPLIKNEARKRMQGLGGSISSVALKNQLRNHTVRAFETFDPNKGKLSTHIGNSFWRITDFVAQNRNPKYMPKEDVERFGSFSNARTEFVEAHGREPTLMELQSRLPGWSQKTIKKMQKGFGAEAFTEMGTDLEHDTTNEDPMQRVRGALLLVKSELTPEQQQFANLHYPEEGTQQKSVAAIAKLLKIPEHKAYRIKKKVEARLGPIIKGQ